MWPSAQKRTLCEITIVSNKRETNCVIENAIRSRFAQQTLQPNNEECIMSKDQSGGTAKDIGGQIQAEVGKPVGSVNQEAKGLKSQAQGKAQKNSGDLKEGVSGLEDTVKKG